MSERASSLPMGAENHGGTCNWPSPPPALLCYHSPSPSFETSSSDRSIQYQIDPALGRQSPLHDASNSQPVVISQASTRSTSMSIERGHRPSSANLSDGIEDCRTLSPEQSNEEGMSMVRNSVATPFCIFQRRTDTLSRLIWNLNLRNDASRFIAIRTKS